MQEMLNKKRKYGLHNLNPDTDHDAPNSFSPFEILNFDLKSLRSDHSLITQKCLDFFKKNTTFFTNAEIKIKFVSDQTPLILTQIQETIEFRKYLESVVNNEPRIIKIKNCNHLNERIKDILPIKFNDALEGDVYRGLESSYQIYLCEHNRSNKFIQDLKHSFHSFRT